MALKLKIPTLDGLDDTAKKLYRQNGNEFVLDLDGADDITKLGEFRDTNLKLTNAQKALQDQLKAYEGIDPAMLATVKEQIEKTKAEEEKDLIRKGKFDEVIARRTAAAGAENERKLAEVRSTLEAKDGTIKGLTDRLASLLVDTDVTRAVEAAGFKSRQGATADITRRAREVWQVQPDGQLVAFEPGTKNVMYSKEKAGTPITMKEYVTSRLAAEAGHLFESATGGGAGGGSRDTQVLPGGVKVLTNPDAATFGKHLADINKGTVRVEYTKQ